jgi:uncharacterized Zn-binding protein involved in type VI secretion
MPRRIAREGDKTTTGCTILPAGHLWHIVNKPIAAVNDPVSTCPNCGKPGIITDGAGCVFYDNQPAAVDGSMVSCGCPPGSNRVIAGQNQSWAIEKDEAADTVNYYIPPEGLVWPEAKFDFNLWQSQHLIVFINAKEVFMGLFALKGSITTKSKTGFYASSFDEDAFTISAKSELGHLFYDLKFDPTEYPAKLGISSESLGKLYSTKIEFYPPIPNMQANLVKASLQPAQAPVNIDNGGWEITGNIGFEIMLVHTKNPGLKDPTPEAIWNWAMAHNKKNMKWFQKRWETINNWVTANGAILTSIKVFEKGFYAVAAGCQVGLEKSKKFGNEVLEGLADAGAGKDLNPENERIATTSTTELVATEPLIPVVVP